MDKFFSGCEVVEMGIQIEENGRDFYTELAAKSDDPKAKAVFSFLAAQEEDHIAVFNQVFKSACDYKPEGAYTEEYFAYMNALASQYVFTKEGKGKEIAGRVKSCEEGLELGIKFEKDSILFYQEMKNYVTEKDWKLIDGLIAQEKEHLRKLYDFKGGPAK